jgi:cytidyltransferase-like protein
MDKAVVSGSFDNLISSDVRLLEEAARLGSLHVYVWSDELVKSLDSHYPKFSLAERVYLLQGIRYIDQVHVVNQLSDPDTLPILKEWDSTSWVVADNIENARKRQFCTSHGLKYQVVAQSSLHSFPNQQNNVINANHQLKKAVVTGCYDWFHSGHLRFFEEAAALGDLYVVVGSDQNVRLLKGEGHPMFSQDERRYMVQSVRLVKQALISTGSGWMDAEPEIERIRPDKYVVNEDGDQPEKRRFCEMRGIQYVVLKRIPKEGLPKRESTILRGF